MPNPGRRKLIVAGGFTAVTYGLLRGLPGAAEPASPASSGSGSTPVVPTPVDGTVAGPPEPDADHEFDLVIMGGRVMDPASGYDQVTNVGIDGGTVTSFNTERLRGRTTIDATGLVVAPGFIDILSAAPNDFGIWFKVGDGVTTNLAMHGSDMSATDFFAAYTGRTPCHFGGAFDEPYARRTAEVFDGNAADADEIAALVAEFEAELREGWIGLDLEPEYTPGMTSDEIHALGRAAAANGVPAFFHGRYSDPYEPGTNAETIEEILDVARTTGVAVHVDHITSTGGTHTMVDSVAQIEAAQAEGLDVSADFYPYDFWATNLQAARWAPDSDGTTWQERFDLDYEDLEIAGTGEPLDEVTFLQLRQDGENPIVAALDSIPEEDIDIAFATPWIMVASDGILEEGANNHPRAAGCFAHTLGEYVRERETLSLMEALGKMTILPARRLEAVVPALRRKGRLARGGDADITVFDPETIRSEATIRDPAVMSDGVEWVLVDGIVVKDPDMRTYVDYDREVLPGQPLTL